MEFGPQLLLSGLQELFLFFRPLTSDSLKPSTLQASLSNKVLRHELDIMFQGVDL